MGNPVAAVDAVPGQAPEDPVCCYAILPAGVAPIQGAGIDPERAVYTLEANGLQAVVSRVRRERFSQRAVEAGLQDPKWLEVHVLAHQQLLDRLVAGGGPMIPLRFCTIYRSEAAIRSILATHAPALHAELARLHGKQEWGIKLQMDGERLRQAFLDKAPALGAWAHDDTIDALQARIAQMSAGGAFLFKKKLENTVAERAEQIRFAIAAQSHARLARFAAASVDNPLPQGSDLCLNAAYLVATSGFDLFYQALESLGGQFGPVGARYALSGPWPAYNFLTLDLQSYSERSERTSEEVSCRPT